MGDTDIKKIESALKRVNSVYKVLITVMIANIIVISGAIWWASNIDSRVYHLESDEVSIKQDLKEASENALGNTMAWKYNEYKTNYLWAERWGQEVPKPPYNTRGGVPNI